MLIVIDLKWQDHINCLHNALITFTSIFTKLQQNFSEEVFRIIYFAFDHSHILYRLEVHANTTSNHLSTLTIFSNKFLRILRNKSVKPHNIELYPSHFTLPIHLLHSYQLLVFITGITVVLTCCKGDGQSQWKTPIFGPSQLGNPLTDFDKI